MKKITFLILTLLASSSHSQSFDEYSTLDGVYYGTSFWVEKENSITHDAVVVGYNENYDQFASTYDAQYSGYASTQQTISPLGMATGDTLDANEDGRMDFITAGIDTTSNAVINLYTQNTDGSFNETTLPMNGISNGKIKTGDLNHDGHADFVVMAMSSGSNYIAKL
ncbi:FG-GAP repeat domain-containing protein [Brumimicrobium oceani]|uniref:VCBS repeat-containing protein n=1 Tax=Brumimicrobium oceani TaxID=2100725 RepID=A0A2U2X199_9FLAO|nr:VCBS repeat-containing protein [Brumimicrobium oceani]PWH81548.1 hypothetical protein DIT68_14560 [Brumimicrobium oceani]